MVLCKNAQTKGKTKPLYTVNNSISQVVSPRGHAITRLTWHRLYLPLDFTLRFYRYSVNPILFFLLGLYHPIFQLTFMVRTITRLLVFRFTLIVLWGSPSQSTTSWSCRHEVIVHSVVCCGVVTTWSPHGHANTRLIPNGAILTGWQSSRYSTPWSSQYEVNIYWSIPSHPRIFHHNVHTNTSLLLCGHWITLRRFSG